MKMLPVFTLFIISMSAISAQAATTTPEVVNAKLLDEGGKMLITTDVSTVKTGKVDFEVANESKSLVHEMLVVRVNGFDDALPFNDKEAKIIEDDTVDMGEVSELEPGQSGSLIVNLKPGNYLLICNMPGHYQLGMFTKLLVTE